jgi:hypothetical protein
VPLYNGYPSVQLDESSVKPTEGATNVRRSTNVMATFSEEMNPRTINTSTVKLYQRVRKKKGKRRVWRWVPITATQVSCDDSCRTVTLEPYPSDPSWLLAANRSHRILITTGAKDKVGNALAQNKAWTFTTGST